MTRAKSRVFAAGQKVEIRYLPSQKEWEVVVYVRRVGRDEMPTFWRGPLGHVVELRDKRHVRVTGQRIREIGTKS